MDAPRMHPLTLAFADESTERGYQEHDFARTVSQGRIATFCAMAVSLVIGLLFDKILFDASHLPEVLSLRVGALLFCAGVLAFSYHPQFKRLNYLALASVGLSGGFGVVLATQYMSLEVLNFYYSALMVAVFFTYNFVGTRFIYALAVDLFLFAAYMLAIYWRGDIPLLTLSVQGYLIGVANILGGGAGYISELQRRKIYLSVLEVRKNMAETEAAKREAEEANLAKSRFLAAVNHDLRQPVHAQGLFLSVLAHTELSTQQQSMVSSIRAASDGLGEMLHTLMDFSRIESGAIQPHMQALRLQPLLNKIEVEFMPQAESRRLSYRSRETALFIRSDPALLEIMVRNLVSNAIRHTEQGAILVACRKRGNHAVLEVWDSGSGIDASLHREIFREFRQLGNPERDRRKGVGLGLAIVEGLARTLSHAVSLRSVPGRGSVFRISVPLASATDLAPQPVVESATPNAASIRILVIDDDEEVRIGTQKQLHAWGFTCDIAESIEEALEAALRHPPNLVISDHRLREHRTGSEAIAELRKQQPQLPALLITGDTAPDRMTAASENRTAVLHKPVAPSVLYRAIAKALDG